jgi:hypothetical protein
LFGGDERKSVIAPDSGGEGAEIPLEPLSIRKDLKKRLKNPQHSV